MKKYKFVVLIIVSVINILTSCSIKTGEINGVLCYPSEYIPSMNVYLQDNITGKIYKLTTKENQREFKFKNILYGEYIAYAYPVEDLLNGAGTKIGGGYTNAVPCGLTYKCNDHSLIKININSKIHYNTISICDFYDVVIPAEKL
jgi:hypothetical protein